MSDSRGQFNYRLSIALYRCILTHWQTVDATRPDDVSNASTVRQTSSRRDRFADELNGDWDTRLPRGKQPNDLRQAVLIILLLYFSLATPCSLTCFARPQLIVPFAVECPFSRTHTLSLFPGSLGWQLNRSPTQCRYAATLCALLALIEFPSPFGSPLYGAIEMMDI